MVKLDERSQPCGETRPHAYVALFTQIGCRQMRCLLLRNSQNTYRMTQHAVVRNRKLFVRECIRRPGCSGVAQVTRRVGRDVANRLTDHCGQGHHRRRCRNRVAIQTTAGQHVSVIHQAGQRLELRGVMTGFAHIVGARMGGNLADRNRTVMTTDTTRQHIHFAVAEL